MNKHEWFSLIKVSMSYHSITTQPQFYNYLLTPFDPPTQLHNYIYVIVVTWARGICLICMPEARGPQARGLRAYISGKSRVHMLQVICNTSGTLKICPNLMSIFLPLYIVTGTRCDCGTLFHCRHDVLAW